jgi:UDP:flavonoid glycosyltransferase YjiC (YdhE family)
VRPFVALAAGLAARGHDVRLGYSAIDGRDWSAVCAPLGFRARAVGADEIAKARASDGPHNTALLGKGNPGKQIYDVVVGLLDPVVEAMWADAEEGAADLDVAVVHLLAHPAMTAALARAIPVATVQPAPVTPTRELAPLGAPESAWLRPLSWWLADRVSRLWLVPRINAFRARAGVAPRKAMFPADDVALSMTCVSPTLVSRPSDWPPHEIITGFFELAGHAHAWERPEALDRFLADGEAPWLMGFGSMLSMPGEETNQCVRTMLEAVDRAGARALVQAPWSELPAMPESPRVFRLGRAPHAEILPHCRGMVHHGGAGTTQAACLAAWSCRSSAISRSGRGGSVRSASRPRQCPVDRSTRVASRRRCRRSTPTRARVRRPRRSARRCVPRTVFAWPRSSSSASFADPSRPPSRGEGREPDRCGKVRARC